MNHFRNTAKSAEQQQCLMHYTAAPLTPNRTSASSLYHFLLAKNGKETTKTPYRNSKKRFCKKLVFNLLVCEHAPRTLFFLRPRLLLRFCRLQSFLFKLDLNSRLCLSVAFLELSLRVLNKYVYWQSGWH